MRNSLFAIACLFLFTLGAVAQMEIVEIEKPQFAKSVAGIVMDPSGAVMAGVTVEERSEDWKTVLRSTETSDKGRFHFSPTNAKTVYYLEFSRSGFNWVRLKLQLDKKAEPVIMVKMPLGT
ncbi:MAG: carboxypeptidase-like regulatory domain-containing protein [Candidatus Sulfotelmatobacter sp.]